MKFSGLKNAITPWLKQRHQWIAFCLLLGFCLSFLPNLLLLKSAVASQSQSRLEQLVLGTSTNLSNPSEAEQRGNIAYQAGAYDLAAQLWQQAVQGYQQQSEVAGQARSLSNLSLAHQALGQWREAEAAITQALQLAPSQSPAIAAQALNTQGQLRLAKGQTRLALESWKLAEKAYAQLPDESGLVRSQLNQIQALRSLGFYRRALEQMEQLEPQFLGLSETPLKVAALTQAGELLRLAGDTHQAKKHLESALELGDRLGQASETAQALMNLGALAQTSREPDQALAYYNRALALPLRAQSRSPIQLAKLSLLMQQKDMAAAQQLWPQIQTELQSLPSSHQNSYQRIALATQLITLKELDRSSLDWTVIDSLLQTTLAEAQALGDPQAESHARGNLAKAYYKQSRLHEAEAQARQALVLAQRLSAREMTYRWQWTLSQIQMEQGHIDEAIAHCGEAVATLQDLQGDLVALNPDILFSFREDIEPIYRGYVDMLLQADSQAGQDKQQKLEQVQVVSQSYLSQAQGAARSLRLSEMTNFLGADCLPDASSQSVSIGQIDPTAAVISPIVLKDRLEILLNLPGKSMRHFTVPVPQAEVESLVKELRYYLVVRSRRRYLPLSRKLYDWMIRPLEQELEGIETLVFSPDGIFQGVPMAALHDGDQFLVERYQIALSPSLDLFEPKPLNNGEISVLAAGLSQARQGFSALPFVEEEINNIQQRIAATTALVDEEFTQEALRDRIAKNKAPIVHIATHGQFGSRPEDTFILAWDQSVNVKQIDQLLQTRAISQEQAIELLVLSACETAAGDNQAMLGLAGLAIQAGARSTLATLWSVNDAGTSALMERFYEALAQPGMSRAAALRQAQLTMLEDPVYRHPLYWASYVMVGNWL